MKKFLLLLIAAAFLALGGAVYWLADPTLEPAGQADAVDAEQATFERILERTLQESRSGVELPPIEAPPNGSLQPQAIPTQPNATTERLPEGYSLGTYRGPMQRAPLTGSSQPDLPPNPEWLDPATAYEAILDQADLAGRAYTFTALRLLPGTNLQTLNQSLVALGAGIEGTSGEFARVRVPADRSRLEAIARLPGVLGIGAVPPGIKADEAFVQQMLSRPAGEQVPVYITLMAADPAGEWRQALSGLGVVVGAYDRDLRSYTANLPAAALAQVVAADFVMSVEPVPVVTANHDSAVPVMGVDGFRLYDAGMERFSGITGSGIAVGVLDTALNTSHVDIAHGRASICGANFVTDQDWDLWVDLRGHGTHVFGTIAGAGRVDPVLAGMAPGLSHLRFGKVLSAYGYGSGDDIRRGMDFLSRPSSCSWQGTTSDAVKPLIVNMSLAASNLTFSGRGVGERKLDSVVHAHSQLYVVAQANSGQHGFSNYGTAKNSLAVGAVDDVGIIAWFSSHGPTADGRLAPNVVGTGVDLTSARGGASLSGYNTFSGTSMASPSVAGVAALLMEARPEFQNRPALTRARLMASAIRPDAYLASRAQLPADNTDGPGAFNNLYGLGLVSARTSLFSHDDPQGWLIGSAIALPDNDTYEYIDIQVPQGAGRLDVVLTWDEQPADTLTRSVLNNLDLWADQGGDCSLEACGEHASRSEVDSVEWLLIEDPVPGTYRIKVVPVEIYGESSTAAVAWKILRASEATPQLELHVEETSPADASSEYLSVDVSVETSHYVASGTTIQLNCRADNDSQCRDLREAFLPHRSRVLRGDGLSRPSTRSSVAEPVPVGEVAAGTPTNVQFSFLREKIPPGAVLHVTATSWNAGAAGNSIALASSEQDNQENNDISIPVNDSFSAAERISGATGQTLLDLAFASREPGEPFVAAASKTLWYDWRAPATGLFRFRLQEADSGDPFDADFKLFTGDSLVTLGLAVEKSGKEISFDAKAGTRYRLRIESNVLYEQWDMAPLVLKWEPADSRPANDDIAYAHVIEGESGSLESTNEGATLERSEFLGGRAASVWYEWTAPRDGYPNFNVGHQSGLNILAFAGSQIGELRLVSRLAPSFTTQFPVQGGETYRIAVAARSADASGAGFTLSWRLDQFSPNVQYNDDFRDAGSIGPSESADHGILDVAGSRLGRLTVEPLEPLATGIGTRWWYWTAPRDGPFTWRLDGSNAFRLTIWTGDALDQLNLVGSLRGGSTLVLDATGDTRYRFALGHSPDTIPTNLYSSSIAISWGETPANDDRVDARAIVGAAGSVDASLRHATSETSEPRSTVGVNSVWWYWSAPTTGWHRFWVEGHPLSAILSVYPDSAAAQAVDTSERTIVANGRVEVHLLARAGERYDIRLAERPGVDSQNSARLRWGTSDPPAYLSYKGAVTIDSLIPNPRPRGLRTPRNLTVSDDGKYLFSTSEKRLLGFLRDIETGDLSLAYHFPADGSNEDVQVPIDAHLWWNPLHDRLIAANRLSSSFSFALPDDGSSVLAHQRMDFLGDDDDIHNSGRGPGAGSPDGRYFYWSDPPNFSYSNPADISLRVYRVDSPTQFALVQRVSPDGAPDDEHLVIPNMGIPVSLTVAPDGSYLYLITRRGLIVFSRDASSGKLGLAREILRDGDPESPFYEMSGFKDVALDAQGAVLFVSGEKSELGTVFDAAVAAFDVSMDPSNPVHLDTLTNLYFETDLDASRAWNHLKPNRYTFIDCNDLVPHGVLHAVDVFCRGGYYVVRWNPETQALEVTDFAASGADDRFGNTVPSLPSQDSNFRPRQMTQSPDGAHVYRATSVAEYAQTDAIHVFERASAMKPDWDDEDAGGAVPGTTTYGVDDVLPGVPTTGLFVPAVTSGASVSTTNAGTTIALNDGGYVELTDGTRYTCTSPNGCTIENGTVTRGAVAGRSAGSGNGEVDRFPTFRTAVSPGEQMYTVGTAIEPLTLPAASGGDGTLTYSLSPSVPGLSFNATTRRLAGTPTTAGTHAMTYTVRDADGDTGTLSFGIAVEGSAGTNTSPAFPATGGPGDQTYTVDTAIAALTLPAASGGEGTLTYSLSPSVPGLSFNATTRRLAGTPTTAGTHAMTYTVTDTDGDSDTVSFGITVEESDGGTPGANEGDCEVGLLVSPGGSCTYPGTSDAFTVDQDGRARFLVISSTRAINVNSVTFMGRSYDFRASHQGDGVWRIDRLAGNTTPPTGGGTETDTSPAFPATGGPGDQTYTLDTAIAALTLPAASGGDGALAYSLSPSVPGLSFNATTRRLTGTPTTAGTHAMTYTVTDTDGDTDTLSFTITLEVADTTPSFGTAMIAEQGYTVGTAIAALTLPAASGGDGALVYSLSPSVPGLSFNAATRRLTGTPTTADSHAMTLTARDADGDADTLGFTITITVEASDAGTCEVALGRSSRVGGTQTVSVVLSDALEADVGTVDDPSTLSARMDNSSDLDIYKIVLSEVGQLVIGSASDLDLEAVFLAENCTEVGTVVADLGLLPNFPASNFNFAVVANLNAGTYYLFVFEWARRSGAYALALGLEPDDGVNDAQTIAPTSDNVDVATADLRGRGSIRSLLIAAQAAGTAMITLPAADQPAADQ